MSLNVTRIIFGEDVYAGFIEIAPFSFSSYLQFHRPRTRKFVVDLKYKHRSETERNPNYQRPALLHRQNFGRVYLEKNEAISINPALQKRFAER